MRASDVATLGPQEWLNDTVQALSGCPHQLPSASKLHQKGLLQILSFYFEYLRQEILQAEDTVCIVDVATTFLLIHEGEWLS